MKLALILLSDPAVNSEEALGRVFNALAVAYDAKQRGDDVKILFHGTATRWPARLLEKDHPAQALYAAVADRVVGVSCACSEVFGAAESARQSGLDLIKGNPVPGTSGLPSLPALMADGYAVITF